MAQAYSLDLERGSSQYASIADNAGLSIVGDMTLEAWVKFESLPTVGAAEMTIVSKWTSTNQFSYLFRYGNDASGNRRLRFINSSTGSDAGASEVDYELLAGVWYHLAAAYDASAGSVEFFVNGRSVGTDAGALTSTFNSTAPFAIGSYGDSSDVPVYFLDGLVKDVRVFNDLRTAAEIVADARTEDVTDANLVAEWNFNNAYTDSSGNGYTLTPTASPVFGVDIPWEAPGGIESADYVLDLERGSTQYATIASPPASLRFTGSFTLEAWVNPESLTTDMPIVGDNNRGAPKGYILRYVTGTNSLQFIYSNAGVDYTTELAGVLTAGKWCHIAATHNAATDTDILYVNGIAVKTETGRTTDPTASDLAFYIGLNNSDTWDGLIRQVRLFDDVRTQAEIIVDARTATVSDANLQAEWSLNNVYTDASGDSNTLTASGSPVFRKLANKIAGGLVSFWPLSDVNDSHFTANNLTNSNVVTFVTGKLGDAADFESGSSQTLSINDNASLSITGALSIAMWVKHESLPAANATRAYATKDDNSTNISYGLIYRDDTAGSGIVGLSAYVSDDGTSVGGTTPKVSWVPTLGVWYHIAMSYNPSAGANDRISLYIDGVQKTLNEGASIDASIADTGASFRLGSNDASSQYFDGMMDEAAIYSRALDYGDILDLYNAGTGITYVGGPTTYPFTADVGSFVLTGQAATLALVKTLIVDAGSFVLTGFDAVFNLIGWRRRSKTATSWDPVVKSSSAWDYNDKH